MRPLVVGCGLYVLRSLVLLVAHPHATQEGKKKKLKIKLLGRIFLGHQGPRRRDIADKTFMEVAFFCCIRHGVAGMSRDLGRDVPDLEKHFARNFGLISRSLAVPCSLRALNFQLQIQSGAAR